MSRACFVLSLFLSVGPMGYAQTSPDSIALGTTTLALGDSQASIMQQLGEYDIQEVPATSSSQWLVREKGTSNAVASIAFVDGRLVSVWKYWTITRPVAGEALANALYGAVHSLEQEAQTGCAIRTREEKLIFVTCGKRYLKIEVGTAQVTEVLESSAKASTPN
jgi:hypothetical protein